MVISFLKSQLSLENYTVQANLRSWLSRACGDNNPYL
jgi:hypothetical protein